MRLGRLDVAQILEQNVGHFHCHAAKIGNEVRACLVARERAFYMSVSSIDTLYSVQRETGDSA